MQKYLSKAASLVMALIRRTVDAFKKGDKLLLLLCIVTTAFGCLIIASATRYTGSFQFVIVQIIAAAGGVSIAERIDDTLLQDVRAKGEKVQAFFKADPDVKAVEGMGLMIGIEPKYAKAEDVLMTCMKHGVLVLTAHDNRIRLLPALNIPEDTLMAACKVIQEALAEERETK